MKMNDDAQFIAGIVKGLVEHDDYAHYFGSTLGISWHLAIAIGLGFIDKDFVLTDKGREWYKKENLQSLPEGRAYMWKRIIAQPPVG